MTVEKPKFRSADAELIRTDHYGEKHLWFYKLPHKHYAVVQIMEGVDCDKYKKVLVALLNTLPTGEVIEPAMMVEYKFCKRRGVRAVLEAFANKINREKKKEREVKRKRPTLSINS